MSNRAAKSRSLLDAVSCNLVRIKIGIGEFRFYRCFAHRQLYKSPSGVGADVSDKIAMVGNSAHSRTAFAGQFGVSMEKSDFNNICNRSIQRLIFLAVSLLAFQPVAWSQDKTVDKPDPPAIADASDEGELAISAFKYPKELEVNLFAAEPDVANPVAIHVDPKGRVFVCETYRQEKGVEDNRNHPEWMDEELAAQTVQDRIDYILKYHKADAYTANDDRIRLLTDTDGDGTADKSQVFSDRYNKIEDGTGAGVVTAGEDVFYTNIPHLWRLKDTDGDGVADDRKSLIDGFGVRFAFRGHDLHGLIVGPDHRLYFSVGDRGYNVSPEIHDASSGAVFSCELDGSDLQVVATGLRNPQELAFDDYGNLFTGDNNSDSGDKARWVYVVPGGDSGWRMYYQYLPDRGPFNRERIWEPYNEDTPAYIVPPIANIGDGPSGIAYYPGTGLPDFFKDRFFYCDFRGVANVSGVRTFKLKPKGAGFEVTDMDQTLWNTLPTDIDFGPDGKVYVSDWVFGWEGEGKGRIYTYHDPEVIKSELVKETQAILQTGTAKISDERLVELLGHADRRVRMASQFELVAREDSYKLLKAFLTKDDKNVLRRLHGLWGFERLLKLKKTRLRVPDKETRRDNDWPILVMEDFSSIETHPDPAIRSELVRLSAKFIAGSGKPYDFVVPNLVQSLKDPDARVRYMAALTLGKIGTDKQFGSLARMLHENDDQDPYLRHAGIMGLAGIMAKSKVAFEMYLPHIRKKSAAVRLAYVAAARRYREPLIGEFLSDPESAVVKEVARAIHDLPISRSMDKLASLIGTDPQDDAVIRRVLNANMIVGGKDNALQLAKFASRPDNELDRRIDALELLKNWENPDPRDYVLGDWRPVKGERSIDSARVAVEELFKRISGKSPIAAKTVEVSTALNCQVELKKLKSFVSESTDQSLRIASLRALAKRDQEVHKKTVLELAGKLDDLPGELSTVVIQQMVSVDQERAIDVLQKVVDSPNASVLRKQLSYKTLGEMNDERSAKILVDAMDRLLAGEIPAALQLDVLMAADSRDESALEERVAKINAAAESSSDKLEPYKYSLEGGNVERGSKIFYEKTEVYCTRCHLIDDWGGAVGPELSTIGKEKDRRYLLESIVEPNKVIAEGFNQTIVLTDEGDTIVGIKKSEDEDTLMLMDKDGKLIPIAKEAIDGSKKGLSSMPADLVKHLSKSEVRDLVEFLASKTVKKKSTTGEGGGNTEHK